MGTTKLKVDAWYNLGSNLYLVRGPHVRSTKTPLRGSQFEARPEAEVKSVKEARRIWGINLAGRPWEAS